MPASKDPLVYSQNLCLEIVLIRVGQHGAWGEPIVSVEIPGFKEHKIANANHGAAYDPSAHISLPASLDEIARANHPDAGLPGLQRVNDFLADLGSRLRVN